MEVAVAIGLALFVASEILPFTPYAANGIVQGLLQALRKVYPYEAHTPKR